MKKSSNTELSRRGLLRMGLTGTAVTVLTGSMEFATPMQVQAQSKLTAEAALAELMAGNKRFTSGSLTAHEQDLAILKQHTEEKQEPFAAVLSCADSRVPVELVSDQSIGHIFVTRVAGNLITPEIIGSLEYGAAVLGTKVILVMGHSNCEAVKTTIQGKEVPGQISSPVSAHPASRRSSRLESRSSNQGQCQDAGHIVATGIHSDFWPGEVGQRESRSRVLRSRYGFSDARRIASSPTRSTILQIPSR